MTKSYKIVNDEEVWKKKDKEESVTKMIFTMLVAFMGAWTPYAISCILRMYHLNLPPHFDAIALITAKASGAINPFIFVMHDEVCAASIYV